MGSVGISAADACPCMLMLVPASRWLKVLKRKPGRPLKAMAAGITVPYDTLGLQTADLINNQWPLRSGLLLFWKYSIRSIKRL
jgi:hypothetical protein